jgi:VIT1/CCC1 family predicted Fe2+/Mn2+ transporter
MIFDGREAILLSLGSSVLGLFGIGAAITLLTGKSIWFSGFRQVAFGLAAAAVTYGIGTLIGVSMAG